MILVASSMLLGSTIAGAAISQKKTPLQRGLAFYKGKTITFIAPTSAGSSNDQGARAIARQIEVLLHATVNVEDLPAGNGVGGGDDIAAATPNGLTIGYLNLGSQYDDLATSTPAFNFNPQRLAFLGAYPFGSNLLVTQENSAYPTFASLLNATASNPVTILGVGGNALLQAQLVVKAFGINAHFITSYTSSSVAIQGFLRGDGPVLISAFAGVEPEIASNVARVLTLTTLASPPKGVPDFGMLHSFPRIGQLEKKYPATTATERKARTYLAALTQLTAFEAVAPSKTPDDEVVALNWAIRRALLSSAITTLNNTLGNPSGYEAPNTQKSLYSNLLKYLPGLQSVLGT